MDNERTVEEQGSSSGTNSGSNSGSGYHQRYNNNSGGQRPMNRKRKKVCAFCVEKVDYIDYKDTLRLRKFTSERAKILPRRISGTCAKHQRQLTTAIKRARQVALMPYISD